MSMSPGVIEGSGGHRKEDCWCDPEVTQWCPECDGDEDCWRCGGEGWVDFYDPTIPSVIVHTDERLPDFD